MLLGDNLAVHARLPMVLLFASLALPWPARADAPPPLENIVCDGKKVGDICEAEGTRGTCIADTCSRLDYSQGTPPTSVHYDCLRCQPGAAAPAKATEPQPLAAQPPAAVDATAPPKTTSHCSVGDTTSAAPLLLGLALLLRRRRHGADTLRRSA